jgi:hypothetical protein
MVPDLVLQQQSGKQQTAQEPTIQTCQLHDLQTKRIQSISSL